MKFHLILLCFLFSVPFLQSQMSTQNLSADIDALIANEYDEEGPGISLLIAKVGETIYRNAIGKANLELDVDLSTDHIFELASITKQFTAVAILMLEEQGKLSVSDNLLQYIPDYPTLGNDIKISHLLNHTSGIKSYTDMPSFMSEARTDRTPVEIIDIFKDEPMDFETGTAFHYNNSGYILLGHIIEIVSGQSYAEFIEENIFDALDMNNSMYGSHSKLIKGRAYGYTRGDGVQNGHYLSMTLPYAAGSLMSSVDDMLKWQNALSNNTLIKKESFDKASNGSVLSNGENITYGFGLIKEKLQGTDMIWHNGGIFGYSTSGIYLPNEDIYVIGLSNCDYLDATSIVKRAAAIALGKPLPSKDDAVVLNDEQLSKWIGTYQFDDKVVRYVTIEEGKLYSQREGSVKMPIYPLSENRYIFEDGEVEYNFSKDNGKMRTVFIANGTEYIGKEIDRAAPEPRKEITVDAVILKSYEGKYELAPAFHIVVTSEENQLFAQATGQPQFELFAESETDFFLKVVDAEVKFSKDDEGVLVLTLYQGGEVMPGIKVD